MGREVRKVSMVANAQKVDETNLYNFEEEVRAKLEEVWNNSDNHFSGFRREPNIGEGSCDPPKEDDSLKDIIEDLSNINQKIADKIEDLDDNVFGRIGLPK